MQNKEINKQLYKEFGNRVKQLRRQRQWTQKELAEKLNLLSSQVNKYESGLNIPSIDKLIQLAQIFGISLDYLLTGNNNPSSSLNNSNLLERFHALENSNPEDLDTVIKLIDAIITKQRMEAALKPLQRRAS